MFTLIQICFGNFYDDCPLRNLVKLSFKTLFCLMPNWAQWGDWSVLYTIP